MASHLNHVFCRVQLPGNCGVPSPFIQCLTLKGEAPQSFEIMGTFYQYRAIPQRERKKERTSRSLTGVNVAKQLVLSQHI